MAADRSIWDSLSDELCALAELGRPALVHIGGEGIANRTGVVIRPDRVATIAAQAEDGESVPVLDAQGVVRSARVLGFEPRSGLCVLEVDQPFEQTAVLRSSAAPPRLGELVMTLAYPSPEGPEARLELIRCLGRDDGGEIAYLQTDAPPFPGFLGAPVLRSDGTVVGMISMNGEGNRSLVLPADRLGEQAEALAARGTPKHAYIGVQTRPVRLSPPQIELLAAAAKAPESPGAATDTALLVTEVEQGGPAEQAGLQGGDILAALEGEPLADPRDLLRLLRAHGSETEITLTVVRGERVLPLPVKPRLKVSGRWP